MAEKIEFAKVNATKEVKREIKIIAAAEVRDEHELVSDMLRIYKMVCYGKKRKPQNVEPVSVADVVASH